MATTISSLEQILRHRLLPLTEHLPIDPGTIILVQQCFGSTCTDSGGNNTVSDFTITVNSINDEPTANLGTPPHPPTIEEDLGTQTVTNFVTGFDVGDGTVNLSRVTRARLSLLP